MPSPEQVGLALKRLMSRQILKSAVSTNQKSDVDVHIYQSEEVYEDTSVAVLCLITLLLKTHSIVHLSLREQSLLN